MNLTAFLPYFQTIIAAANIAVIVYGFYKFLGRPHTTLENRVAVLESKVEEIEEKLNKGNKHFEEQDRTNEVLIRSTFALLEFEVHYCETEHKPISKNLEKAKDDLHEYLAKNRKVF